MIIISCKPGRLANSITLFSRFIAFSIETKIPVCNLAFDDYAKYFKTTSKDLFCRFPRRKTIIRFNFLRKYLFKFLPYLIRFIRKFFPNSSNYIRLKYGENFDLEDPANLYLFKKKFVFVDGWLFNNHNQVQRHKQEIINYFEPLEKEQQNINNLISKARKNTDILIGVHIRRTDYKEFFDGIYYYEFNDYKKVMNEILSLFPNKQVKFLICSDENLNENIFKEPATQTAGFNFIFGTHHLIEDMYSFAKCDYIIGPPSTYTIWASYYGNVPLYLIKDLNKKIQLTDFGVC